MPEKDISPEQVVSLTEDQKYTLENILAAYIGPMAAIVCEGHLATGDDIETIIQLLAKEIPDSERAMRFRLQARHQLLG